MTVKDNYKRDILTLNESSVYLGTKLTRELNVDIDIIF